MDFRATVRDRLVRRLSDLLRAVNGTPRELWRVSAWDRTALPILISAGIIFYNFSELRWAEVWAAGVRADLWLALPAMALPHITWWFLSTLLTERYFKWFHGPFPYWKYFWVHGSVHVLDFINPAVSAGSTWSIRSRRAGSVGSRCWEWSFSSI